MGFKVGQLVKIRWSDGEEVNGFITMIDEESEYPYSVCYYVNDGNDEAFVFDEVKEGALLEIESALIDIVVGDVLEYTDSIFSIHELSNYA